MTGVEYLRAMIAGERPMAEMMHLLSMRIVAAEEGMVRFEGMPAQRYTNPAGVLHGGWMASLLDSTAALTAYSTLPADKVVTTVDVHLHCLRPVLPDRGKVICEGSVINNGRSLILVDARARDSDGRLLGYATSTCMVLDYAKLPRKDAMPPPPKAESLGE